MPLQTMPCREPEGVTTYQSHTLPLMPCCPVSQNPQPGSTIRISYNVTGSVLEVYALRAYFREFVGGHPSGERNMEGMIQKIAEDCAECLQARVRVLARLKIDAGDMTIRVRADPRTC